MKSFQNIRIATELYELAGCSFPSYNNRNDN